MLRAKRMTNIAEVLEEVEVFIDIHLFNEFSKIESSFFLTKVLARQNLIDMRILKMAWRTLNCTRRR